MKKWYFVNMDGADSYHCIAEADEPSAFNELLKQYPVHSVAELNVNDDMAKSFHKHVVYREAMEGINCNHKCRQFLIDYMVRLPYLLETQDLKGIMEIITYAYNRGKNDNLHR